MNATDRAEKFLIDAGFPANTPMINGLKANLVEFAALERIHQATVPVDLLIVCQNCGKQHVDRPDRPDSRCPTCDSPSPERHPAMQFEGEVQPCRDPFHKGRWANPPHKSHTCRKDDGGCGHIFPLAMFPTNGVAAIPRKGKDDTWVPGMVPKTEIDAQALDLALQLLERMDTESATNALHAIAELRGELAEAND